MIAAAIATLIVVGGLTSIALMGGWIAVLCIAWACGFGALAIAAHEGLD